MTDLKHEILQDIKRVAVELGEVPSRDQYKQLGRFSPRQVVEHFENWSLALLACGMVSKHAPKHERNNSEPKDIQKVLTHYHENAIIIREENIPYPWMILGDTHFPFSCFDSMSRVYFFAERIQPKLILQIGDLYDCFGQTKFPRTHNVYTAKQEAELGRRMASEMWGRLRIICPLARCFQMHGNHTERPLKRILERAPELEHMLDLESWMKFDGVELISDPREEFRVGNVKFIHGYMSQLGAHRDHLMSNVVTGHSHLGGVSFRNMENKILWELNAGYLGDPESKALSYTPTKSVKWTKGFGLVDSLGPRFVPFS